jgi:hypothetical protein
MANANQSQPQVTYDQISDLFDIRNMNDKIFVPQDTNVFSTNVFIPMEATVNSKTEFYLSGMVKLVETFKARIDNSDLKDKGWMLFIYYDSMFDNEYIDSIYELKGFNSNNNATNRKIKETYENNQLKLKKLLGLYKEYLELIKENKDNKYSFVKLYSFNCSKLKRKMEKGYLGHPSTFGSMVRFISMFNPKVSRVFCINISHAISPRLCYLINKWVKSGKPLLTNNVDGYEFNYNDIKSFLSEIMKIKLPKINDEKSKMMEKIPEFFQYRFYAGLFGFYKNETKDIFQERQNTYYFVINELINKTNEGYTREFFIHNQSKDLFFYGIDELILGYIFSYYNNDIKNIYFFKYKIPDEIINSNKPLYDHYVLSQTQKWYEDFINSKSISQPHFSINRSIQYLIDSLEINKFGSSTNNYYNNPNSPNSPNTKRQKIDRVFGDALEKLIKKNHSIIIFDKLIILYYHDYLYRDKEILSDVEIEKINEAINKIKINVINYIISKLDEQQISYNREFIVNFLENYLLSLKCIDIYQRVFEREIDCYSYFASLEQKNFIKKTKSYIFKLLKWISDNNLIYHRYESRSFMNYIGQENIILNNLTCIDEEASFGLNDLLDSYDEVKPLIIYDNILDQQVELVRNFPEFFTFMSSKVLTISLLVSYYTDPDKVLPVPYVMPTESQEGGSNKNKSKQTKKLKKSKKSKQTKKLKK